MAERVKFASADGATAEGLLGLPTTTAPTGSVVLLHEWWGLIGHIASLVDRLAAAGFVVLAPDLYGGKVATSPDEAAGLMTALSWSAALTVIEGAVAHLRGLPRSNGRVGVTGFCMGGAAPSKIGYALGMILLVYFGIVFVIDLEHRLILHPTSIFGAVFGLMIGTIAHGIGPTLWGGFGGFVIMIALYYFGVLFARIRTRRLIAAGQEPDDEEALGAGDVILITIFGFILGWPLIWFGFLLGVLLGGFFSLLIIALLVLGRQYKQNAMMMFIPYGPYFVASAFLVVFFPKFLAMIVPG